MAEGTEGNSLLSKSEDDDELVVNSRGYGTFVDIAQATSFQNVRSSIAAGMMDLSLFIANCNQLANIIRTPDGVTLTALEWVTTSFIIISILLQIVVVLLCIWSPSFSNKLTSKGTVTCIFLILVVNVFVACLNNENQHVSHCTPTTPPATNLLAIDYPTKV